MPPSAAIIEPVRTYAGKGRAKRSRLKLEGRILAKKDEL
jgi:hypothetical protein